MFFLSVYSACCTLNVLVLLCMYNIITSPQRLLEEVLAVNIKKDGMLVMNDSCAVLMRIAISYDVVHNNIHSPLLLCYSMLQ